MLSNLEQDSKMHVNHQDLYYLELPQVSSIWMSVKLRLLNSVRGQNKLSSYLKWNVFITETYFDFLTTNYIFGWPLTIIFSKNVVNIHWLVQLNRDICCMLRRTHFMTSLSSIILFNSSITAALTYTTKIYIYINIWFPINSKKLTFFLDQTVVSIVGVISISTKAIRPKLEF